MFSEKILKTLILSALRTLINLLIVIENLANEQPDILVNPEIPNLTESDFSEDEDTNEKSKIYQEVIMSDLKESMYELFRK